MALLLRLPEDLSREILNKWIWPDELSQLDSSFCSHLLREQFLQILKTLSELSWLDLSEPLIAWIISRDVPWVSLISSVDQMNLLTPIWSRVKQLVCDENNLQFANECPNLTILECAGDNPLMVIDESKLNNLIKLRVTIWSNQPSIEPLLHCRSLRDLQFMNPINQAWTKVFSDVFQSNPLMHVTFKEGNRELILALIKGCGSTLVSVKLLGESDVTTMSILLQSCPSIAEVTLKKVRYNKTKGQLSILSETLLQPKFSVFWQEFKGLLQLELSGKPNKDSIATLAALTHVTLLSLTVYAYHCPADLVQMFLVNCPRLTELSCQFLHVPWQNILPANNKIQRLSVSIDLDYLQAILDKCQYLQELTLSCHMCAKQLYNVIKATRDYRHRITGATLVAYFTVYYEDENEAGLIYDGQTFSGSFYTDHEYVFAVKLQEERLAKAEAIIEKQAAVIDNLISRISELETRLLHI